MVLISLRVCEQKKEEMPSPTFYSSTGEEKVQSVDGGDLL